MKYILTLLIPFALVLIGCGDSSSSLSSSATTTSASTPTVLPSGLKYSWNPTITLTADLSDGNTISVNYVNSSSSSIYPVYSGPVDVTMTNSGSSINLTFDFASISSFSETLSLILDNFIDVGGDGNTDEFTVTPTLNGIQQSAVSSHFDGAVKPVNQNISPSQRVDTSGTPTEEQFQKHLVGFAIKATNITSNSDHFIYFRDSTNMIEVNDVETGYGTYNYNYNNGNPILKLEVRDGEGYFYNSTINLDFSGGWYLGSWQETEHSVNGASSSSLDSGTFEVYSGTSLKDLENFLY